MQHRSSIRVIPAWLGVEGGLRLFLPFTGTEIPRAMLAHAESLAAGLNASIELLAIQVIPFSCPLTPNTQTQMLYEKLREASLPSQIVLTRNPRQAFVHLLPPRSLVLLASSHWLSAERKLARQLRRAGHEVLTC